MDRYLQQLRPHFSHLYLSATDFIVLHTDVLILMIIAFILAIWIIPETSEASKQTEVLPLDLLPPDLANDYNFMGTHESTPAQFDLALAYASMGKVEQAMEVLHRLTLSSHPETRLKASQLQDALKNKLDALDSN